MFYFGRFFGMSQMGHAKKFCPMDEEGQYVQKDDQLVEKFGEWMRYSPLKKSFGRKLRVPAVAPRAARALKLLRPASPEGPSGL